MNKSDAGKLGAIKSKLTKRIQKAERISLYDLSPVRCKFCHKALSYAQRRNTFCDHVCAASHNNVRVVRNFVSGDRVKKICPTCKAETTNAIFCSTKCNHAHNWQKTKQMIESLRNISSHLNMLDLIASNRHMMCVEHQNISCHKNGVRK